MKEGFKPLFCFVYSLYDDNGSYFMERDDYVLSFHGKEKNYEIVEVLVDVRDLSPFSKQVDLEEFESLKNEFGEILCNSEIVANDYGFLTYARKETIKSLVVEIFKFLVGGKITYHKSTHGNPLKREIFEKIWLELKELYYSAELDDLM